MISANRSIIVPEGRLVPTVATKSKGQKRFSNPIFSRRLCMSVNITKYINQLMGAVIIIGLSTLFININYKGDVSEWGSGLLNSAVSFFYTVCSGN